MLKGKYMILVKLSDLLNNTYNSLMKSHNTDLLDMLHIEFHWRLVY